MKLDRRTIIQGALIAGTMGACGIGVSWLAQKASANTLLRPPGALKEQDFLASCIKCGQCIQVCPFGSLKLIDLQGGINTATPFIDPQVRGCYLCDLFPCILCCPSGALDDKVEKIEEVSMGIAYVTDPGKCFNLSGTPVMESDINKIKSHGNRTELEQELNQKLSKEIGHACELCLVVCKVPDRDNAIKLEDKKPVIGRSCVGCGACQEVCPPQIIRIAPAVSFEEYYKDRGEL